MWNSGVTITSSVRDKISYFEIWYKDQLQLRDDSLFLEKHKFYPQIYQWYKTQVKGIHLTRLIRNNQSCWFPLYFQSYKSGIESLQPLIDIVQKMRQLYMYSIKSQLKLFYSILFDFLQGAKDDPLDHVLSSQDFVYQCGFLAGVLFGLICQDFKVDFGTLRQHYQINPVKAW